MAGYNNQRNYGGDRTFASSLPRNCYPSASTDSSMPPMRHLEQTYSGKSMFSESNNTNAFPRSEVSNREMFSKPEFIMGGICTRPPFVSDNMSSRRQLSSNEFSRHNRLSRSPLGGGSMLSRPALGSGNTFSNPALGGGTFSRPALDGGNTFSRPALDGNTFSRPALNGGNTFSRPALNGKNTFSRPAFCGGNTFSRPSFGDGNTFSMPVWGGGGGNMLSRPPLNSGNTFSSPMFCSSNMFSRPRLCSSNMFSRPQMSSGGDMFNRPQFNGNQNPGVPFGGPLRMNVPYACGSNQRSPQGLERNLGPNSFTRRNRFLNIGESQQIKTLSATQQNKPKFKPAKKKSKKNRFSKVRDDGTKLTPWMTDELYAEVKKKNEMYFKAKTADSTEMWQEFRLQRNKVSSLIKEAKLKGGFITRKKKEDEDDGQEKPFSCDTCDKAFVEESKLEEHLRQHKKCEVGGCQFEAHPKVVELHKKLQHDTGYADIISKLDDAAAVEKWRNERKSHFPTLENVIKRQAEQEEKLARGEVLETRDFGKFKKRRCEGQQSQHGQSRTGWKSARGSRGRQRGRVRGNENRKLGTTSLPEVISLSDSDDESHITLHKFPGTSAFTTMSNVPGQSSTSVQNAEASQESNLKYASIYKSETEVRNLKYLNIPSDALATQDFKTHVKDLPLSSEENPRTLPCENGFKIGEELVSTAQAHYKENGCSSESDPLSCVVNEQKVNGQESEDDGPAVEPVVRETETTCHVTDFTEEPSPGDKDKISDGTSKSIVKPRAEKPVRNSKSEQSRKPNWRLSGRKQSTLLEKLLANDIRHERNVILQCIRYTVNNNFFGVAGQRTSKS